MGTQQQGEQIRVEMRMHSYQQEATVNARLGGAAFLAVVLTAMIGAIALFLKKKELPERFQDRYDGWEDSLGV